MKTVVITGSTRGIGYGLATAFLTRGCNVVVSGRTEASVDTAVANLCNTYLAKSIFGHPCQVTEFEQMQSLWDVATAHFGNIDIWINNAGVGHSQLDFWQYSPEQIKSVVEINLIGAMYGSSVALNGMLAQGNGALYNMEGLGSDGRQVDGLTLYGSTKYGLRYLHNGLVNDTRNMPVLVGALSPGMVITDLLTRQYEGDPEGWEKAKRIFNILADHVDTVTPWLADKVLANKKNGVRISWLTKRKIMTRFLLSPFRKRDLFTTQ